MKLKMFNKHIEDENEAHNISEEKNEKRRNFVEALETIIIAIGVFSFITFGFDKSIIMSGSMEPTLITGDTVIFTSIYKIDRGDIIEFEHEGEILSKRVLGIGGDVISFSEDGKLIRNGEIVDEPYIMKMNSTFPALEKTYIVPENSVFVLGDNRLDSFDSRFWENPFVNKEDILGKYFFTMFSPIKADAASDSTK